MSKYVYLSVLIVAVVAYTVLGDEGSTESPLADMFKKLTSISQNISAAGAESFKDVQEKLGPLYKQLQEASKPVVEDLKKKFGPDSEFAKEVKKTVENFGKPPVS